MQGRVQGTHLDTCRIKIHQGTVSLDASPPTFTVGSHTINEFPSAKWASQFIS